MLNDYKMTANRMGQSSGILHRERDFYNACYLAGYVVECFTKILIQRFGKTPQYIHEVPKLIDAVEKEYVANSSVATLINRSGVNADLRIAFAHITSNWHPLNRYSDSHPWDEPTSGHYQAEVTLAQQYIAKLELDGVI